MFKESSKKFILVNIFICTYFRFERKMYVANEKVCHIPYVKQSIVGHGIKYSIKSETKKKLSI